MDNQVCLQPSKEEESREAIKETIRNIPNPPTTEEIDNMTHAEMVKAITHRATLIRRAKMLQKATIIELTRRVKANELTISKLRAEIAELKRQIELICGLFSFYLPLCCYDLECIWPLHKRLHFGFGLQKMRRKS